MPISADQWRAIVGSNSVRRPRQYGHIAKDVKHARGKRSWIQEILGTSVVPLWRKFVSKYASLLCMIIFIFISSINIGQLKQIHKMSVRKCVKFACLKRLTLKAKCGIVLKILICV